MFSEIFCVPGTGLNAPHTVFTHSLMYYLYFYLLTACLLCPALLSRQWGSTENKMAPPQELAD